MFSSVFGEQLAVHHVIASKKKKKLLTVQRLDSTVLLLAVSFKKSSMEHTAKVTCRLQHSASEWNWDRFHHEKIPPTTKMATLKSGLTQLNIYVRHKYTWLTFVRPDFTPSTTKIGRIILNHHQAATKPAPPCNPILCFIPSYPYKLIDSAKPAWVIVHFIELYL